MGKIRKETLLFPLSLPAGGLETIKELFDVGVFLAVEETLSEISGLRLVFPMSFFSKGVSCEGGIVGYLLGSSNN